MKKKASQWFMGIKGLRKENLEVDLVGEQPDEIVKCSQDYIYFINTYCHIVAPGKGKILFDTRFYQDDMLKIIDENPRSIFKLPRQSGKSIAVAAYVVWCILFKEYYAVSILANKEKSAKNILKRAKLIYRNLPIWMQVGVTEWSKLSVELENGSTIEASATSASGTRSESTDLLIIDEAAHIMKTIWDDFYTSIYPTISSNPESKIVMISTPKGMNHFYKFWTYAEAGKNSFCPYEIAWNDVPGRDEKFKAETIPQLANGLQSWLQEFECEFLGSAGTLVSTHALKNLMVIHEPEDIRFEDKFRIFEMPIRKDIENGILKDHMYFMIADFGEGVGLDYSTIQVIDITDRPWKQVAVYEDNDMEPREMPFIMDRIGKFYNNALAVGETNNIGIGILDDLNYDLEYDNIFYGDETISGKLSKHFGIKMTVASKKSGNMRLKANIEDQNLVICDENTISQFSTYIKKGKSYEAEDESDHDDLITPLVLFSYFMNNKKWVENWLDQTRPLKKDKVDQIEESLLPAGYVDDGITLTEFEDDEPGEFLTYFPD
jgi:hypothetical protein